MVSTHILIYATVYTSTTCIHEHVFTLTNTVSKTSRHIHHIIFLSFF